MTQKQKNTIIFAIVLAGGAALLIFKGNIFQTANIKNTGAPSEEIEKTIQKELPLREISVKAFKFGYEPNVIKATKGEKIKINIENADVLHGIRIPDLGLRGDEALEFTANQAGEFTWYCNNFCGEGHRSMQGKLIVEEQAAQGLSQPSTQLFQNQNRQSANRQEQVFFGDKGENLILEGGSAEIPFAVFESQKARFYNIMLTSGKTVYFFVVKDKNGKYRAAANACQICFQQKKGFRQEGNEMVCNNCGNRYSMEKIATEKGGCNPAPINPDLEVRDGQIVIKQTDLEQVSGLF